MATLSLSNIEKTFGDFQALRDVTLDIKSGEFICLLGGSGCGKTTLLRIVAGLETQTAGEMLLDGSDLSKVSCHERNVGMVFQSLALFPHLNVGQNIAYGLEVRGVPKAERTREGDGIVGGCRVVRACLGARHPHCPVVNGSALRLPAPWQSNPNCS